MAWVAVGTAAVGAVSGYMKSRDEKKRAKAERDAKAKKEKRAKEAQRKALESLAADWSGRNV